jgi:hypothetical protein
MQPGLWNLSDMIPFSPRTILTSFTVAVTLFSSVILGATFLSFRKS